MKHAVIWGAGHIGRGFVAEILREGGFFIDFVDTDQSLVNSLSSRGEYTIHKALPDGIQSIAIRGGFRALHTSDARELELLFLEEELLISIAVFKSDLGMVAQMLAPLIALRAEQMPESCVDIMMNVNMTHPDSTFRRMLDESLSSGTWDYLARNVGITGIFAMCISPTTPPDLLRDDPLAILNNGFCEQAISRNRLKSHIASAPRLRLSDMLEAEEVRKLYTLNMAHCAASYLGMPKGFATSHQAVQDSLVRMEIVSALDEAAIGLCGEYGFTEAEMSAWRGQILALLDNPHISDGLDRLGADPIRKLGGDDRLVMPAKLCAKHGGTPRAICRIIRAGLAFPGVDEGARRMRQITSEFGISGAVARICGISVGSDLHNMILDTP